MHADAPWISQPTAGPLAPAHPKTSKLFGFVHGANYAAARGPSSSAIYAASCRWSSQSKNPKICSYPGGCLGGKGACMRRSATGGRHGLNPRRKLPSGEDALQRRRPSPEVDRASHSFALGPNTSYEAHDSSRTSLVRRPSFPRSRYLNTPFAPGFLGAVT